MKKFLLLFSAAILTLSAGAANRNHKTDTDQRRKAHTERVKKIQRAAATAKWLPGTIQSYYWIDDGTTGSWMPSGTDNITYNGNGLVTKKQSEYETLEYEYNTKGQVITEIMTYEGQSAMKYVHAYDELTGAEISETAYRQENGSWVMEWKDDNKITRDGSGNIIKIEQYYQEGDNQAPELDEYAVISYGTDGKANKIITYEMEDGKALVQMEVTNIVWEATNGQIYFDDYNDLDIEDYFSGNNRMKSADVIVYDYDYDTETNEIDENFSLVATYPDSRGSVSIKYFENGQMVSINSYKVLDNYGSYRNVDLDTQDNSTYTEETIFDAYGIILSDTEEENSPYYDYSWYREATVTYHSTLGYPTEVIYKSGNDKNNLTNSERVVYSNFPGDSSIADVTADPANSPVEYFNLQGVRVAEPSNGIYIRRQGSQATKVMIK